MHDSGRGVEWWEARKDMRTRTKGGVAKDQAWNNLDRAYEDKRIVLQSDVGISARMGGSSR